MHTKHVRKLKCNRHKNDIGCYLPNYFKLQSGPDCGAADCGRGRFGIKSSALVLHTANCCLSTGNLVQICEAAGFTLVLIVEQSIAVQIVEQSIVVQIVEQRIVTIVVQIVEQRGKRRATADAGN